MVNYIISICAFLTVFKSVGEKIWLLPGVIFVFLALLNSSITLTLVLLAQGRMGRTPALH